MDKEKKIWHDRRTYHLESAHHIDRMGNTREANLHIRASSLAVKAQETGNSSEYDVFVKLNKAVRKYV